MEHLYGVLEESSSRAEELFARGKANDQQIFAAKSHGSKDPTIGFVEAFRIWNVAALTHDPVRAARLYNIFVANGTWQVPTLAIARDWAYEDEPEHFKHQPYQYLPYPPQPIVSKLVSPHDMADAKKAYATKLKIVEEMNHAGVRLLAGTDGPPFLVAEELELLVTAGLSPAEALRTATSNPATFLNRTEELGSITKGKLADAVLLNANPLENIRAVRDIDTVVFDGRRLRRPQIDALLSDLAKRAAAKPEKQH